MSGDILKQIASIFCKGLCQKRKAIIGHKGRFPKREIFLALNRCKKILKKKFGDPVKSRWSIGTKGKTKVPSDTKVLEYLVDYGICRFSIPQAIGQLKVKSKGEWAKLKARQYYEILLAVESEMGNHDEILRDFLKLLDIKSRIKCLIFSKGKSEKNAELYNRIEWVMGHYGGNITGEHFLIIGLPVPEFATLTDDIELRRIKNGRVTKL